MPTKPCDCQTININGETYHRGSCASHGSPALDREKKQQIIDKLTALSNAPSRLCDAELHLAIGNVIGLLR